MKKIINKTAKQYVVLDNKVIFSGQFSCEDIRVYAHLCSYNDEARTLEQISRDLKISVKKLKKQISNIYKVTEISTNKNGDIAFYKFVKWPVKRR